MTENSRIREKLRAFRFDAKERRTINTAKRAWQKMGINVPDSGIVTHKFYDESHSHVEFSSPLGFHPWIYVGYTEKGTGASEQVKITRIVPYDEKTSVQVSLNQDDQGKQKMEVLINQMVPDKNGRNGESERRSRGSYDLNEYKAGVIYLFADIREHFKEFPAIQDIFKAKNEYIDKKLSFDKTGAAFANSKGMPIDKAQLFPFKLQ